MNEFPVWIRATHWINVLFIGFLMRAGIQILAAYPRLYWNDHCAPGTEWLKLTRRKIATDKLWTALEQEESPPSWLAQPGGNNLGLGRHWHFFGAIFWVLNGLVYVTLLFATDRWRRLIPTSWGIFPDALHTATQYMQFQQPPASAFDPFDPLQQLTYFAVIFILAPFLLLTGMAQSPAIDGRFPRYLRIFGGRQRARSLHFLGLVAFVLFTIGHVTLVAATGLRGNFGDIVLGQHQTNGGLAVGLGIAIIAAILAIYAVSSWYSLRSPLRTKQALARVIFPPMRMLSLRSNSQQQYERKDISPYFLVNGRPPTSNEYGELERGDFGQWRLEVRGLVEQPLTLSLAEIRAMPAEEQITKHHCIQGWSGVAAWKGAHLAEILPLCRPLPTARYMVFWSYQLDTSGRPFYESLDIRLASHPQTLLAYEMNGDPLGVPYGAPVRLRVETELGFKMVKWLCAIEFTDDLAHLRDGQGGSREDNMHYEQSVSI